jgi:sortase (surface protein transpeptidase)
MSSCGRAGRVVAVLLLATVVGCGDPPGTTSSGSARVQDPPAATAPTSAVVRAHATPAALEIPAIGVNTGELVDLGLAPSGAMEVPDDAATAGWFALSPVPGEVGPSVVAAHVNYKKAPGVFARLHEMTVGDTVVVRRADGTPVRFTAYRVERFTKSAFPTRDVYGNTEGPELRLITCGGSFDDATGHYRDNVVVFARLA